MFVVDDPMLVLILRLVVDTEGNPSANREFLDQQLKAIRHYLAQYPAEEHGDRAMEWVVQRAAQYRRDWERNAVASRTVYLRCADCPLAEFGAADHCEIHEQWLYLLHRYLTGTITSPDYIQDALELLRQHKDRLRSRIASVANKEPKARKANKEHKKNKKKEKKRKKLCNTE